MKNSFNVYFTSLHFNRSDFSKNFLNVRSNSIEK